MLQDERSQFRRKNATTTKKPLIFATKYVLLFCFCSLAAKALPFLSAEREKNKYASCYTTNQRFAIINRPSSPCRNAKWTESQPFFFQIYKLLLRVKPGPLLISLELVRRHLSMYGLEKKRRYRSPLFCCWFFCVATTAVLARLTDSRENDNKKGRKCDERMKFSKLFADEVAGQHVKEK